MHGTVCMQNFLYPSINWAAAPPRRAVLTRLNYDRQFGTKLSRYHRVGGVQIQKYIIHLFHSWTSKGKPRNHCTDLYDLFVFKNNI